MVSSGIYCSIHRGLCDVGEADMTKDEKNLEKILAQKGYVVANMARRHHPGEKLDMLDDGEAFSNQPWYVIAETTQAEAEEQSAHLELVPSHWKWAYPYFYRVSTD
jgi:hypothetical protein